MQHYQETLRLFENSNFYYAIIIGMDSNYSYVSPNYDRNFDFLGGSLLGKPYDISVHPDDTRICGAVAQMCFENPDRLFPATLRKHDGKGGFVFTQWEFKALFNEQGQPDGILCIGYNITEHVATRDRLADIGYIQAHLVRRPLANLIGLIGVLDTMKLDPNLVNIKDMISASASELDAIIKEVIGKAG
jgi:hypothetical protein